MSLLAQLLYDNTPRPLPECARTHSYALPDEKEADEQFRRGEGIQCGGCYCIKEPHEMHVKQDGTIGRHCKRCTDRKREEIKAKKRRKS